MEANSVHARRIDGKARAEEIYTDVRERASALRETGITPCLALMRVGADPASTVYLRAKAKACRDTGVASLNVVFEEGANPSDVMEKMTELNADPTVHGILLQLPLPTGWDSDALLGHLNPAKDVDGFHPVSVGRLVRGEDCFVSCTPLGIQYLLHREGVSLSGTPVAIVGRSNVVGRPLANLLSQKGGGRDATVFLLHSRSVKPELYTRQADVVIAAAGKAHIITPDMIKPGAVVIDVGMHRIPHPEKPGKWKLIGDVHPDVAKVASALTPVPGGVGPMTVAMLLRNTVDAAAGGFSRPVNT